MVNASAFAQSAITPQATKLILIAPAAPDAAPLTDAAIRALSRLTGALVVCRLSAIAGTGPVTADQRLTLATTPKGWRLQGEAGTAQGDAEGLAIGAVAVAMAAAAMLGLEHARFGGHSSAALAEEAAAPGRETLTVALPQLWSGTAGTVPADLPEGCARGVAAALEARRLVLAFRASGTGSRDELAGEVAALLDTARAEAPVDPLSAWGAGTIDAMLTRRYADAACAFRACLADDACNAAILHNAAMAFAYAWDFDLAVWCVRRAARVSPADGLDAQRGFAGALAAFHGQQFAQAVGFADAALAAKPGFTNVLRLKAAALVHLGRGEEARTAMALAMQADPTETVMRNGEVNPLREYPGFARFLDGLREAGMPA